MKGTRSERTNVHYASKKRQLKLPRCEHPLRRERFPVHGKRGAKIKRHAMSPQVNVKG